jgi:hypothetical protein
VDGAAYRNRATFRRVQKFSMRSVPDSH